MPNDSEDSDSEEDHTRDVTIRANPATVEVSGGDASVKVGFSTQTIQNRLAADDHISALVLTSTRLENVLFRLIQSELGLSEDQTTSLVGDASLGTYGKWCSILLDDFDQSVVDDIAKYRNKLVHYNPEEDHGYDYIGFIEDDPGERLNIEKAIKNAIELINNTDA